MWDEQGRAIRYAIPIMRMYFDNRMFRGERLGSEALGAVRSGFSAPCVSEIVHVRSKYLSTYFK